MRRGETHTRAGIFGMGDEAESGLEADLGRRLRRLRLARNRPQAVLAAQAGISLRALRNLESGTGSSVSTLLRVLTALECEAWLQALISELATLTIGELSRVLTRQRARR